MTYRDNSTPEQVRNLIAVLYAEYECDQACDYKRINILIEKLADIVGREIGGKDRLLKLGIALEYLADDLPALPR